MKWTLLDSQWDSSRLICMYFLPFKGKKCFSEKKSHLKKLLNIYFKHTCSFFMEPIAHIWLKSQGSSWKLGGATQMNHTKLMDLDDDLWQGLTVVGKSFCKSFLWNICFVKNICKFNERNKTFVVVRVCAEVRAPENDNQATHKKRKSHERFMWFGRVPTFTAKENPLSLLFHSTLYTLPLLDLGLQIIL